ncbi:STAS domain-containing protein [Planomonospora corallina]|uniref:STAS domain-containing protein n=1 Tax=Planomonospora corallina TaxID=1806052 RepID=A0ABV8HYY9_9ACTN
MGALQTSEAPQIKPVVTVKPPEPGPVAELKLVIGAGSEETVVTLAGSLTMSSAYLLGRVLTELVDQGHRFLVLDVHDLESCDGAGWTLLLGIRWRLATVAGRLRLTGLPPRLMRSCRQMELAEVFELDGKVAEPAG